MKADCGYDAPSTIMIINIILIKFSFMKEIRHASLQEVWISYTTATTSIPASILYEHGFLTSIASATDVRLSLFYQNKADS
jgi:hypothetical protein